MTSETNIKVYLLYVLGHLTVNKRKKNEKEIGSNARRDRKKYIVVLKKTKY